MSDHLQWNYVHSLTNQLWSVSCVPVFPNLSPDVLIEDTTQPENRIHELKVFIFTRFFPAYLCTVLFWRMTCLSCSLQMSHHCFGDGFPKLPAVQHHRPAVLQPWRAGDHVCIPSHLQHLPARGGRHFGRRWEFNEQKSMLARQRGLDLAPETIVSCQWDYFTAPDRVRLPSLCSKHQTSDIRHVWYQSHVLGRSSGVCVQTVTLLKSGNCPYVSGPAHF